MLAGINIERHLVHLDPQLLALWVGHCVSEALQAVCDRVSWLHLPSKLASTGRAYDMGKGGPVRKELDNNWRWHCPTEMAYKMIVRQPEGWVDGATKLLHTLYHLHHAVENGVSVVSWAGEVGRGVEVKQLFEDWL